MHIYLYVTLIHPSFLQADSKSEDDKKIEKLLKRTSREIYKLRKSKAGNGKPDIISFK